jgi:hypothetical protein
MSLEDTAIEEGVTEESPASTSEEGAEISEESPVSETKEGAEAEESPTLKEGAETEEGESPTPKHATAEDRIKFLWAEGKRKDTLIAEKNREAEKLRAELDEKPAVTDSLIFRPKRDSFDTDEEYDDAYEKYRDAKLKSELAKWDNNKTEDAKKVDEANQWNDFDDRVKKLDPKKFPNVQKAIESRDILYSGYSMEFVKTSEVGPQIADYFYSNPDVADRIARMPMAPQMKALYDLQTEIVKTSSVKTVSSAPKPINPGGNSGGIIEKDPDKMNNTEWAIWREKTKKIT